MNKKELKVIKNINKESFEDSVIKLTNNIETFAQGSKIIAITSALDYCYEVVLSYYLAKSYVEHNKKTIIIETHFSNEFRGVIDIVGEQIKDDNKEVIKLSSGVDVIFAKETKFNAEELHSKEFKELIERSKKTYDYIILLVAPLKINNDLFALNKVIDASMLVAKKDETVLTDLCEVVKKIKDNNLPFLGVTLIK